MASEPSKKVIALNMIISYPSLREARPNDSGDLFYDCTLITTDESNLSELKAAVIEAAKQQFGDKGVEMLRSKKLKSPFRTDTEAKGYPEGATFFSCKSKVAPGLVSDVADPKTGKPAIFTGDVRPGMIVNASVRPYYYKQQGGGIALGLGNVQILTQKPFTPLDNRIDAADEFDAEEAANASSADLDDVL